MAQELLVEYSTIVEVLPKVPSYYVGQGDGGYDLFSIAEQYTITCTILGTDTASVADFEANFKANCSQVASKDDAFLLGTIANKVPLVIERNSDGIPLQSSEPRVGSELIKVTSNFCDPTSWWYDSARSESETMTDSGDGLTFNSTHVNWIDVISGKLFYDPDAEPTKNVTISVTVDGTPATMVDPLYPSDGGDYTVNFAAGTITFGASQSGKTIVASYAYAQSSLWALVPIDGKAIDIESVEAQFSEDAIIRDTVQFELWGYNPSDLPNKILYGSSLYRSMRNFVDEAQGSYPVVPAIGGDEGRGLPSAIYGFPFRYGTVRRLSSENGIELRIRLSKDTPFGGSHCTATFYCTVRDLV